jgi:hypothetical protein
MADFNPDNFLASPVDRVLQALEDVSKTELLAEIEKLRSQTDALRDRFSHSDRAQGAVVAASAETQKALNIQIEANNKLDKQLGFERIRRAQAEKILNEISAHPDAFINTFNQQLVSWKNWLSETVRQQEAGQ